MKQVNGGSDDSFIQYLQLFNLFLSTFFVSVCFRISRAKPNCTRLLQCIFLLKIVKVTDTAPITVPYHLTTLVSENLMTAALHSILRDHETHQCNLDVLVSILNANKTTPRFQLLAYRFVISGKVKSAHFNKNLSYILQSI